VTRLLFLAAFFSLGLSAASLEAILAKMDEAATGFKGMRAKVKRSQFTAVIKEESVEIGRMVMRRPKPKQAEFLIEISEPDRKSISIQGKSAQIYYPKINTVQVYDIGKFNDLLTQALLLGFGASGKDLNAGYALKKLGEEPINGKKCTRLELVPKSEKVLEHIKKVELWIGDAEGYPLQQKIFQPSNDTMTISYSEIEIVSNLDANAVKLNLPKNVKKEHPQR
jgi:outer membrane lipoprotein-sorting protein